jgi:hypothetical protein
MKSTVNKNHPAYLILLFYVFFSLLPSWNNGHIVLCYGAEGHLEIEVKTAQSCSGHNSMRDVEQCENSRPCFCVDIPISKNSIDNTICVTKGNLKNSSVRYNYFHTPQAAQSPTCDNVASILQYTAINNTSRETLRTTILLI